MPSKTITMVLLGPLLLSGCSLHHNIIGTWLSPGANTDDITRITVLSDNTAATFNSASQQAATECDWKAMDKQTIEMHCVSLINPVYTDTYRFTVTGQDTAELYKKDRLVTKLIRYTENR